MAGVGTRGAWPARWARVPAFTDDVTQVTHYDWQYVGKYVCRVFAPHTFILANFNCAIVLCREISTSNKM